MFSHDDGRSSGRTLRVDSKSSNKCYSTMARNGRWRICMSVSATYLEATMTMATVARELEVNALVNMSNMTVSQMIIQNTTPRLNSGSIGSAPMLVLFINSSILQQEFTDEDFCCRGNGSDRSSADR